MVLVAQPYQMLARSEVVRVQARSELPLPNVQIDPDRNSSWQRLQQHAIHVGS